MKKYRFLAALVLLLSLSIQAQAHLLLEQGTAYNLVDGSSQNDGLIEYIVFSSAIVTEGNCDNHNEDESDCWLNTAVDSSESALLEIIGAKKKAGFKVEIRPVSFWDSHAEKYLPSDTIGVAFVYRDANFESFAALGNVTLPL